MDGHHRRLHGIDGVGGHQIDGGVPASGQERGQGAVPRLDAQRASFPLVQHGEAGIESGRQCVAAQQTGARYVPTTTTFRGDHHTLDPTGMLAPDGDHPNAAGQEAIAEEVYAAVPAG